MIATCVHVWVKPGKINEFIEASSINHNESVKEPGNLRFDVLQDEKEPSKFLLYEAYETDQAAAAHKHTPHYIRWRDTVAEWMERPREGVRHQIICPTE